MAGSSLLRIESISQRLKTLLASLLFLFRTPSPKSLRKNSIAIFLILSIPKVLWDVFRFRASSLAKVGIRDTEKKEEDKQKKDDPRVVLSLSVQKTVVELRKTWENCLLPYCDVAPNIESFLLEFLNEFKLLSHGALEISTTCSRGEWPYAVRS